MTLGPQQYKLVQVLHVVKTYISSKFRLNIKNVPTVHENVIFGQEIVRIFFCAIRCQKRTREHGDTLSRKKCSFGHENAMLNIIAQIDQISTKCKVLVRKVGPKHVFEKCDIFPCLMLPK